ncbi:hypothetical protein C1706_03030 [Propioniciclava flava]|uniref:Uncharacterized protein n=1 Tax=Propioniciclava flava TaxID=2072026 RepID=A0A4Q2EK69_9ACTN|nr:hypothetical protein C1706_03030 [Propioniciclava flava]
MSFDSVVALKDAAVRTGFYCERWRQTDQVQLAVQSGTCSERDVFSIYLSSADVSAAVQALKRLPVEVHLLVGPNWIINSRYVLSLKENMGGMIVTASNG